MACGLEFRFMPPSSDSAVRTSFSQISKLSGSSSCSTCQQSTKMIARWLSFHSPPQHLAFSAPRFLHRSRQRRPSSVAGRRRSCTIWERAVLGRQPEIPEGFFFIEAGIKCARLEMKSERCLMWLSDPRQRKGCGEICLT
jgi:hypothetical protein